MKMVPKNTFFKSVILPALTTIVVSSAIGLAIVDENIRPVFVHTVIVNYFRMLGKSDDRENR